MSVRKCKRLVIATVTVVAMFAMLPAIALAQSTNYRFESNSNYDYFPGFFTPFLFDISGTFTLNENMNMATITNADFQLSGPPSNPSFPLSSVAGVEDLLQSDAFVQVPSIASLSVYQSLNFLPTPFLATTYTISVDNVSGDLTISGSGSPDGVSPALDGDFFQINATAVAVPEPAGLSACVLLAITLIARRRRGVSFA